MQNCTDFGTLCFSTPHPNMDISIKHLRFIKLSLWCYDQSKTLFYENTVLLYHTSRLVLGVYGLMHKSYQGLVLGLTFMNPHICVCIWAVHDAGQAPPHIYPMPSF